MVLDAEDKRWIYGTFKLGVVLMTFMFAFISLCTSIIILISIENLPEFIKINFDLIKLILFWIFYISSGLFVIVAFYGIFKMYKSKKSQNEYPGLKSGGYY